MKKLLLLLFIVLSLSGFAQRTEVDTMTNRINYTVNPLNGLNVRGIFRIRTINDADTITSAKIQTWDNSAIESAAATEQLADTLEAADHFIQIKDSATKATPNYMTWQNTWYDITSEYTLKLLNAQGANIKAVPVLGTGSLVTGGLADGALKAMLVYIPEKTTLTGVKWFQVTAGNYTAADSNCVALYKCTGANSDLVAKSISDDNIWKQTSNSLGTKAFQVPYVAEAGWYKVVCLYNQSAETTAPVIALTSIPQHYNLIGTNKLAGVKTGTTTAPATLSDAELTVSANSQFLMLY